jgi:multidrug efflux pump subunit AcrA (membrane-fusion protein)
MDGVIGAISVSPNESVHAGQVLFSFDESQIAARRTVAEQTLAAAQVEYRQFAQQALSDMKSKSQLALLLGKIEERRAEANYLEEQVTRSQVVAPIGGLTLFDDPSEWVGKPVQTGERVMRIAASDDAEVEVWIPLGDAIELPPSAPVELYLSSNPLASVRAVVRYFSQEAQLRPNGSYAYRLRASLVDTAVHHRVGLKGVAKVSAGWVPLVYWILRRPVATVRQTLGI